MSVLATLSSPTTVSCSVSTDRLPPEIEHQHARHARSWAQARETPIRSKIGPSEVRVTSGANLGRPLF